MFLKKKKKEKENSIYIPGEEAPTTSRWLGRAEAQKQRLSLLSEEAVASSSLGYAATFVSAYPAPFLSLYFQTQSPDLQIRNHNKADVCSAPCSRLLGALGRQHLAHSARASGREGFMGWQGRLFYAPHPAAPMACLGHIPHVSLQPGLLLKVQFPPPQPRGA